MVGYATSPSIKYEWSGEMSIFFSGDTRTAALPMTGCLPFAVIVVSSSFSSSSFSSSFHMFVTTYIQGFRRFLYMFGFFGAFENCEVLMNFFLKIS